MLCDSFSINACNLLSNYFVKKILSNAYNGLAGPYQYFGWYDPGRTGHTASAALAFFCTAQTQLHCCREKVKALCNLHYHRNV